MADSKSAKLVYNNVTSELEAKLRDCNEALATNNSAEVTEPMLLEDYTGSKLPLSFENLLNYANRNGISLDRNDTTALFIYIMMLETGFVTSDYPNLVETSTCNVHSNFHYRRLLFLSKTLPKNWKRNNTYTFTFVLAPFIDHVCNVVGVVVSDDFVINCNITGIDNSKFCMLIDSSMYIIRSGNAHLPNMFQNLKTLSIKFKSNISNAVRTLILHTHSLRSPSLQGLPPEIIINILKYCDRNSFMYLKRTCKYFEKICINKS